MKASALLLLFGLVIPALAQRQMENLTRGIVAVRRSDGGVFVSWRLFGTDPDEIVFNLYRVADGVTPVRVNDKPAADSTNFIDRNAGTNPTLAYFVRPVLKGKELKPSKPARVWEKGYLEIPIQPIAEYAPATFRLAILTAMANTKSCCIRFRVAGTTRFLASPERRFLTPTNSTARTCGGLISA